MQYSQLGQIINRGDEQIINRGDEQIINRGDEQNMEQIENHNQYLEKQDEQLNVQDGILGNRRNSENEMKLIINNHTQKIIDAKLLYTSSIVQRKIYFIIQLLAPLILIMLLGTFKLCDGDKICTHATISIATSVSTIITTLIICNKVIPRLYCEVFNDGH